MREQLHPARPEPELTPQEEGALETPQAQALLARLFAAVDPDTPGRDHYVRSLAVHLLRRRGQP